jgi:raffinose/stachyose/melibiose transport system permease protein
LIPGFVLFIPLIIIPFFSNVVLSFTEWSGIGEIKFIGFENFIKAFQDEVFWASFGNNLLLIIAMAIVPTIIGLFLAVMLFDFVAKRISSLGANIFRAGFYLPQIITIVVSAIAWKWIFQPNWGAANWLLKNLGLAGVNWLGEKGTAMPSIMIMMVWFQIGYPLVIFMAALQRIDPQLYEAAVIEGASGWTMLVRITIPQMIGEIFVVVLTAMIHALKIFAPVYAMTQGGPGYSTSVTGYFAFRNFFEAAQVGYGSTLSMILSVIIIVVTIIFIRVQNNRESEG